MKNSKNKRGRRFFSMFGKFFTKFTRNTTNPSMSKATSIIRTEQGEDTGLRGNSDGSMTVDKAVFFNRPEVQELLNQMSEAATSGKVELEDAV